MKNRQRATLYASIFLLTAITFSNSSAMKKKHEQSQNSKHAGNTVIDVDALQFYKLSQDVKYLRETIRDLKRLEEKNCEKRKRDNRQEIDTLQASIKEDQLRFLCATGESCIGIGVIKVCPEPLKLVGLAIVALGVVRQGFYCGYIVNSQERVKKLKEKED